MIEAIIFDNDGLLIDSEPVWDQARRDLAQSVNRVWNTDDHQAVMGVSTETWATYMIKRLELSLSIEEVVQQIVQRMAKIYQKELPFLPGAKEAIRLAADSYPTAIASGSHPDLLEIVGNHPDVKRHIKVIISADTLANGKPAPDVYLETANRLNIPADRCLCLEDSGNGILAGVRAGMIVVAIPNEQFPPAPDILNQAHHILKSLEEFPQLLENLKQ